MSGHRLDLLPDSGIDCRELARWHLAEWQSLYPEDSVESFAADLARCQDDGNLPLTWVLRDSTGRLAGSVSLVDNDLAGAPQLSPWIANLWTHPDARRHGLGSRLLQHAVDVAWRRGESALYLYTTDRIEFYRAHHWQVIRDSELNGIPITVMALHRDART